jgi:ribosomal-protein-alanine N-acetyltransferase
MTHPIETDRLELISMTPAFLQASLRGDLAEAERQIQLSLPGDWPDYPPVLELRLEQLAAEPAVQPWLLRAIALRASRQMVGYIGFHTAPGADYLKEWSPHGVEFGFTIFEPYRRQGFAREASLGLMRWAHEVQRITSFVVTISPDNMASRALAAGLGFVRIGSHIDEIDGLEDVFVLNQSAVE